MVCGGESVKPAGVCPVSNDAASCGGAEQVPKNEILDGPKGRIAVRDVDGDGLYNPAVDEIYAVAEGEVQEVEVGEKGADAGEVTQRLKAMGIGGTLRRGTPIGLLKDYVDAIREARAFVRDGDAKDVVELALADAKDAAAKARIPVDTAVLGEIRSAAEYYGLISVKNLSSLPYFDKENRDDVEGCLDAAKEVAGRAGIPDGQVENDAQGARYLVSQIRLVEGIELARAGKKGESMKVLEEGMAVADMGGFEETFEKLLMEEYAELVSADSLSNLPFYDEEGRNDVEGWLDAAAVVGKAAGIPQERIEQDAQRARYELCLKNYVDAYRLAKDGKAEEAAVFLEKANSIADMGDLDGAFGTIGEQIAGLMINSKVAKQEAEAAGEKLNKGIGALLDKIEGALTHLTHPVGKGAVKAESKE